MRIKKNEKSFVSIQFSHIVAEKDENELKGNYKLVSCATYIAAKTFRFSAYSKIERRSECAKKLFFVMMNK